jgi:hypothetical protein
MLPDPVPRRPGALLALPIWIVVLGNGPTPWPSWAQSLPAPSAVLAQVSLKALPVEPLRKISFDVADV